MDHVLIIGGSRYFGKLLVHRLRDAGSKVTVLNRGSTPAPDGVTHLVADRDDEAALAEALGGREFDVVLDQVCYTPGQAEIAGRVFAGRTGRYVMTSTVEVYDLPAVIHHAPVTEDVFDAAKWPVTAGEGVDGTADYGEAKRRAEAVFAALPGFPFVSVRTAHVLGGTDDFTGRLGGYVRAIRDGDPIAVYRDNKPATFISNVEIAEFLHWAAAADFLGPVNACSHGLLTVQDICEAVAAQGFGTPKYEIVDSSDASPYAFDRYYPMSNARAEQLGFRFSTTTDWLPQVIRDAA